MKSDFVLLGEKSQSLDVVLVSVGEVHAGTYKLRKGQRMSATATKEMRKPTKIVFGFLF
jgi:DTW domain-containing protein YfiP